MRIKFYVIWAATLLLVHSQESLSSTPVTLEMEERVELEVPKLKILTILRKFSVDIYLTSNETVISTVMNTVNQFHIRCSHNFPTKVPVRVVAKSDQNTLHATIYLEYPPIKTWTKCEYGSHGYSGGYSLMPMQSISVPVSLPLVDGATKTTTIANPTTNANVVTTTFTLRLNSCENGNQFTFAFAAVPEPLLDNSLSSEEIRDVKPVKVDSEYRWGRTIGRGPTVSIDTESRGGAWWVDAIQIRPNPIEIYVNRRLRPTTCAYTATLNHEFQHASAILRYWERSANTAKQRICQLNIPTTRSRNTDLSQQEAVKSQIAEVIRSSFSSKINKVPHEVLDTPEEYLRVHSKCTDWP